MNRNVKSYVKAVERRLLCGGEQKKQLQAQLAGFLERFLEENPDATEEQLHAALGTPEEMANLLMEPVSSEERQTFLSKQKRMRTIGTVLLIVCALSILIFALFFKQRPIEVVEDTTHYDRIIIPLKER